MYEQRATATTPISQTERVILTLREMLLRGDFAPGERLAELTLGTPAERLADAGAARARPARARGRA